MDLLFQIWGGLFYLLNKVLFALSEGRKPEIKRNLRILGWLVYILGVPAWVAILVTHNNWIAASLEAGAIPAMVLGLYNAVKANQVQNRILHKVATISTYGSLTFGVVYSLIYFGGITSLTQVLEICAMIGFLLGSFYLAKNSSNGWLMFMLMNISMAGLMFIQDKHILMYQQILSLSFVCFGYYKIRSTEQGKTLQECTLP